MMKVTQSTNKRMKRLVVLSVFIWLLREHVYACKKATREPLRSLSPLRGNLVMRINALLKGIKHIDWFRTRDLPVTRPLLYHWAIAYLIYFSLITLWNWFLTSIMVCSVIVSIVGLEKKTRIEIMWRWKRSDVTGFIHMSKWC